MGTFKGSNSVIFMFDCLLNDYQFLQKEELSSLGVNSSQAHSRNSFVTQGKKPGHKSCLSLKLELSENLTIPPLWRFQSIWLVSLTKNV